MDSRAKGTVTSLSSMFPAEEARKASHRMHEIIAEKRSEIDNLNRFVADNSNLINLVQRLPDELHHDIMVPFGKSAFFPGRLVHTNEFMVLLGEGYYAERTAKQTVDILKRRGKTLESQIDSVKAVIEDIKAKASFFDRTAEEAAVGLVEIREEYTEEDSVGNLEKSDAPSVSEVNRGPGEDDEEYARIMSRFDELEREELEAEEEDNENDEDSTNLDHEDSMNQCHIKEVSSVSQPSHPNMMKLGNLSLQPRHREESSRDIYLMQTNLSNPAEKNNPPSILKSSAQSCSKSNSEVSFQLPEPDAGTQISRPVTDHSNIKPDAGSRLSRPATDSLKAFTGTIVERADNLQSNPENQTSQPSNSQPSKPMSRFRMRRK